MTTPHESSPPSVRAPLAPGAVVLYDQKVWQVACVQASGTLELLRPGTSTPQTIRADRVLPIENLIRTQPRTIALEDLEEDAITQAQKKLQIILTFLGSSMSISDLEEAASTAGCHVSTFRRWVDRYVHSGGKLSVLVPWAGGYGNSNRRIKGQALAILQEVTEVLYLGKRRLKKGRVFKAVKTRCESEGVPPPSRGTVYRYLGELAGEKVVQSRVSSRAARQMFGPLENKATTGDFPLHVIQMDHTLLDIFIRLGESLLRRPWITVAIDTFSRMVVGMYLSFDAPSALSVGLCLYRVMMPKQEWLEAFGIRTPWPCTGRPYVLLADNGKEFRSHHLELIAQEHRFVVQFRPVKEPQYGAYIERLMGTLALDMEILPGATFRDLKLRKDIDVEARACLTLDQLEQILLHLFVEVYSHGAHSGLGGASPISKWREGWAGMNLADPLRQHVLIEPSPDLLLSLLPSFERTVQQDGIYRKTIRYFDHAIVPHIRGGRSEGPAKKYRFHLDPRNIRFIYFKDPISGEIVQIAARDTGWSDISEWEFEGERADSIRKAAKTINHKIVAAGEASIASIVADGQKTLPKKRSGKRPKVAKRTDVQALRTAGQTSASLGPSEIRSHLKLPSTINSAPTDDPWSDIPTFDSEDF